MSHVGAGLREIGGRDHSVTINSLSEEHLSTSKCRMTVDESLFSEQKRCVQAGDCDRDKLNRQEHAAHDSFRGRRREDEIHAEKFRCLRRRSFPWRKQQSQDQHHDHSIEHREIELIRCRDGMAWRGRRAIRSTVEPSTTMDTEAIDLRL